MSVRRARGALVRLVSLGTERGVRAVRFGSERVMRAVRAVTVGGSACA